MKMVTLVLCEKCNEPIHDHQAAVLVQGNISTLVGQEAGSGLVGNNIVSGGTPCAIAEVHQQAFHTVCLIDILRAEPSAAAKAYAANLPEDMMRMLSTINPKTGRKYATFHDNE